MAQDRCPRTNLRSHGGDADPPAWGLRERRLRSRGPVDARHTMSMKRAIWRRSAMLDPRFISSRQHSGVGLANPYRRRSDFTMNAGMSASSPQAFADPRPSELRGSDTGMPVLAFAASPRDRRASHGRGAASSSTSRPHVPKLWWTRCSPPSASGPSRSGGGRSGSNRRGCACTGRSRVPPTVASRVRSTGRQYLVLAPRQEEIVAAQAAPAVKESRR
jgi:hypothetical protein